MSLYDYKESLELSKHDYQFYALIMAAIRKADNFNLSRLRIAFPEVYEEFMKRYHAGGGILTEEERRDSQAS